MIVPAGGSQLLELRPVAGKRRDFRSAFRLAARTRALERENRRQPPTERRVEGERARISLDHFDRAGSPLCAYYVFITAAYRESRDKTVGASPDSSFCRRRGTLWGSFHVTLENPGVSGGRRDGGRRRLIN